MAKQDALTNEQKEIVRAQNDALLFLPDNRDDRLALILTYRREKARENDLIAQAKKDSGAGETLKNLQEQRKLKKQAISIINTLAEMEASARAIAVRQVISYAEDFNWVIPDLFDNGAVGQQAPAAEADKPVFDSTSEGQRRGGAKAEPRQAPGPAPEPKPRDIPTLSVQDAQTACDAELAKRDGKRGPEPKALKEARAALEMAKALEAEKAKQGAAAAEASPEPDKSNVIPIHRQMAEGSAEGDAFIREQAEKLAAERAAKASGTAPSTAAAPPPPPPSDDDDEDGQEAEPVEAAPEPSKEKPRGRGGRKKAGAESKAALPPPPPADDDVDDEGEGEDGTFPDGAPAVGAHPERPSPDFRIG